MKGKSSGWIVRLWKRIYTHEASENAIDISQDSELFNR